MPHPRPLGGQGGEGLTGGTARRCSLSKGMPLFGPREADRPTKRATRDQLHNIRRAKICTFELHQNCILLLLLLLPPPPPPPLLLPLLPPSCRGLAGAHEALRRPESGGREEAGAQPRRSSVRAPDSQGKPWQLWQRSPESEKSRGRARSRNAADARKET